MLDLQSVTLCCADTRAVPQALDAVRRCMAVARFGRVVFLGPDPAGLGITPPEGIEWVAIAPLNGIEDYNRLMLHGLAEHVATPHVLIVQWDGFINDPTFWRSEYLAWDYIGAPWYHRGSPPGMVGNGGFSLRSRKLLLALQELPADPSCPEDEQICMHLGPVLAQRHGIRIAPLDLAQSFACEYGAFRPAFGFHGMHNFAHVLAPQALSKWLGSAPREIIISKHARNLVKALMVGGRSTDAIALIRQRALHAGWSWDQCLLLLRALGYRLVEAVSH